MTKNVMEHKENLSQLFSCPQGRPANYKTVNFIFDPFGGEHNLYFHTLNPIQKSKSSLKRVITPP